MQHPIPFDGRQRKIPRRAWTETVTPKRAEALLGKSKRNRPITPSHVETLARTMSDGKWGDSNDRICLDWNGDLLNGHHRLHAIIKSGVSVSVDFVEGLDPESFKNMDRNKVRTHGNVLGLEGISQANSVAACAALVWRYQRGERVDQWLSIPSSDDLVDIARAHPDIGESIRVAAGARPLLPISLGSFLHYATHRKMPEKSAEFFRVLRDGATGGAPMNSAAFQFREALSKNREGVVGWKARARLTRAMIRAWNAHARGKTCSRFKMDAEFNPADGIVGCDLVVTPSRPT